ncbi:MAG: LysR family transcriptional regulator [Lawsonibacter sp.]|jgi:LysR family hydrogen peroxide-inducible transcriptional activator
MREHLDFTKFHYVEMVAELKSFTKAAERLFISQPALTKSISKLERDLGVKLFDRTSTPVQLTYAGERYLAGMKNISVMSYQLDRELEEISNTRKERLIVGIPDTRSQRWLPKILPDFLQKRPGIDLRIVEAHSTGLVEKQLAQGTIDLAAVVTLPMTTAGLDYEVIYEEQLLLMASPQHPIFSEIDLTSVDLRQKVLHYLRPERLQDQPYIAYTVEQGLQRAANQLFTRFSIHPRQVLEISNTATARSLAQNNMGFIITTTNSVLTQKRNGHDAIYFTVTDPAMVRSVIVSYKRGQELSPAAQCFIKTIQDAARSVPELCPHTLPILHDLGD